MTRLAYMPTAYTGPKFGAFCTRSRGGKILGYNELHLGRSILLTGCKQGDQIGPFPLQYYFGALCSKRGSNPVTMVVNVALRFSIPFLVIGDFSSFGEQDCIFLSLLAPRLSEFCSALLKTQTTSTTNYFQPCICRNRLSRIVS